MLSSSSPLQSIEFVGAVREGDSRRSTLRYRARHRPALHDATTGTSASVSGRDHVRGPSRHRQTPRSRLDIAQITPRFSSAAAKRKLPFRLFERGLLTHPRCLSRPRRRLSHDGQILRRHRQGRQGCVPDSSRPRAQLDDPSSSGRTTTTKMSPEYLAAIHPCVHAPLTHPLAPSSLHPQTSSPAD